MKPVHTTESFTRSESLRDRLLAPLSELLLRKRTLAVGFLGAAAIGSFLPNNVGKSPVDGGLEYRIGVDAMIAQEIEEGPDEDTEVGTFTFGDNPNAILALLAADPRTDIEASTIQLKATTASAASITEFYQIPQPSSSFEVWRDPELSKKAGFDVLLAVADSKS